MAIFSESFNRTGGNAPAEELPLFREMAYDFENNRFREKDGGYFFVEKNDALRIWIYFALHLETARFRWRGYSWNYGNEIGTLFGKSISMGIVYADLKRFITEALLCNPYIQQVTFLSIELCGSKVLFEIDVETVYDKINYKDEVYVS